MKLFKRIIHRLFVFIISILVGGILRFYLKKWQVANYSKIPQKSPVIFASNHQNAFLDPLVIFFSQSKINYFLVRANIFKHSIARFWLKSLNMLPIYRVRDGFRSVAKNEQIIKKCTKLLMKGDTPLVIFVEGNHGLTRNLRPTQKGVTRIAFATMEANNFEIDLAIVPTGINYGRHTRFRSDLLLNYGDPIYLKQYEGLYKESPQKAYQKLTNDIFEALDKVVLSIRPSKYYSIIENEWLKERAIKHKKINQYTLLEQFNIDKKLIDSLSKKYKKADIKIDTTIKKEPIPPMPSFSYIIFMFPIFIYGFINTYLGYKLLSVFLKKLVPDIHFYASIKSTINLILAPLVFLFQAYLVYVIFGNGVISIFYFISSPFFSVLAFDYKFAVFDRLPRMKGTANYSI